jgi:PAS domain-containing protein
LLPPDGKPYPVNANANDLIVWRTTFITADAAGLLRDLRQKGYAITSRGKAPLAGRFLARDARRALRGVCPAGTIDCYRGCFRAHPNLCPNPTDELIALRAIVEGTASAVGDEFFRSLVKHLASAMNVGYAFVAEFTEAPRVQTLAYWKPGEFAPNVEWDVRGTPCEDVVKGKLCHYPTGVARRFPEDTPMVEMGIDSYLGVPLLAPNGQHLGHLAVFDTRPMSDEPRKLFTFRIFAARAAAELERLRMDRALRESERRYRDLYEEAPIAYIYEDLESRFVLR